LGVGVDEGPLVDASNTLQIADIEGVLSAAVTRMLALELAVRLLLGLGLFQRDDLRLVSTRPSWALLASSALSRFFIFLRYWRSRTQRTPAGETMSPRCLSSLATRTWPKAGCSIASVTMAFSISCGTRFFNTGFLRLISCRANSPPWS